MNKFIHDSWNVVMNSKAQSFAKHTRHKYKTSCYATSCVDVVYYLFDVFRVYYRIWCKCAIA